MAGEVLKFDANVDEEQHSSAKNSFDYGNNYDLNVVHRPHFAIKSVVIAQLIESGGMQNKDHNNESQQQLLQKNSAVFGHYMHSAHFGVIFKQCRIYWEHSP